MTENTRVTGLSATGSVQTQARPSSLAVANCHVRCDLAAAYTALEQQHATASSRHARACIDIGRAREKNKKKQRKTPKRQEEARRTNQAVAQIDGKTQHRPGVCADTGDLGTAFGDAGDSVRASGIGVERGHRSWG